MLRSDFKADLLIKKLICYPNDSISLTFEISPKDGNEPYSYKWKMPDKIKGNGPFIVNLVEDLRLSVKINDANSKQLDFYCLIKKDTIDSLKYDYRNDVIGSYECDFYSEWHEIINSQWQLMHKEYRDTLKIYKSKIYSNIICGNELKYNLGKIHLLTIGEMDIFHVILLMIVSIIITQDLPAIQLRQKEKK